MEDEGGREELLLEVDFGELGVVEAAEGVAETTPWTRGLPVLY